MCDPGTLIAAASTAVGVAGSLGQGSANSRAAEIAAQTAQANSQMALSEGSGQIYQVGQRVAQAQGRTRAAFGGGNIEVNSGSSLADQVLSAQQGSTDQQLLLARSLNQSAGQRFQAATDYQKKGQAEVAGVYGAATAVLNGLASINKAGGFGGGGGGGFNPLTAMANGFGLSDYGFA